MKEIERQALLSQLVRALHKAGSWAGRMHIQKYTYLSKKLLGLPVDYDFILYQRGPYSFDLDSDIRSLRSQGYLEIERMPAPYGPRYSTTMAGEQLAEKLASLGDPLSTSLQELAESLASKDATDMELLATAFFVQEDEAHGSQRQRVARLIELKPHFDNVQATRAFAEVRQLRETFQ